MTSPEDPAPPYDVARDDLAQDDLAQDDLAQDDLARDGGARDGVAGAGHAGGSPGPRTVRVGGRGQRRQRTEAGHETERLVRRAAELIESARPMPLSASVMINRDEVLELLGEALERIPEDMKEARWLLKEREDFLAEVRSEGDEILDAARARAERMVQRSEVVKAAELRARRVVENAEAESRRLRHECEDFCDQRLASFEIVLERTQRMVASGREKLAGPPLAAPDSDGEEDTEPEEDRAFFDQDEA